MMGFTLSGIDTGLALALTYLLHSTLWIGCALWLVRRQPALSPSARQLVWRAALVGPLVSSALGLGLGQRARWVPLEAALSLFSPAPLPSVVLRPLAPLVPLEFAVPTPDPFEATLEAPSIGLGSVACLAWAGVALLCAGLVARAVWRQRRALRRRRPVVDAATLRIFERVRGRAGIRHRILLTRCATATSPMVLNQHEICLPERTHELGAEAVEAVLAHELAHIERRDGIWLYATLLVRSVFWFQPLNRKLSAELLASAELAADDRAVELCGDALGLARTLIQIAGWARFDGHGPSVAMARAGSSIVERVTRLVEPSRESAGSSPRRVPWSALAALAAVGVCSPSVGTPRALLEAFDPSALSLSMAPLHAYPIWESSRVLPRALPTPVMASPELAPVVARVDRRVTPPRSPVVERPRVAQRAGAGLGYSRLPVEAMFNDVVSQVLPRAVAFSQVTLDLAFAESGLHQRIAMIERALARGRVPIGSARAQLARLSRDVAELTARRRSLEHQFRLQMQAWGQRLEARFAANFAPRSAALGAGSRFE